jgi:uncharacterized peroxidase-related enzyme
MSRLPLLSIDTATAAAKPLLTQVNSAFGTIPNMFRAVAHSPAALKSMWGSFGALGGGVLGAKLGEQIAVAIADKNRCEYCLAAHTVLGQNAGVSAAEMALAQHGQSADSKTAAAIKFALRMVERRGQVEVADLADIRSAGFDDQAIVEIVAHVALNIFTNYTNIVFDVPVDFPAVKLS